MIKKVLPIAMLGAAIFATGCKNDGGFKKVKGIEYKIVKDAEGKNAQLGDIIEFQYSAKCDSEKLGSTYEQNGGKPVQLMVQEIKESGQFQAAFPYLSAGDSAVIYVSCDTLLKNIPQNQGMQLPPWLKKGKKIEVLISVVSVKSKADAEKEAKEKSMKQAGEDDKALQDYFAKNNIKAEKTATGLYYSITTPGAGANIAKGQVVKMNYIGKTLDGKIFDANMGEGFKDRKPFEFPVGVGQVIPGWDEGVQLLKKGSKAMFYIPSTLAYGPQQMPGIPANSCLTFEVEVLDVKSEAPAATK